MGENMEHLVDIIKKNKLQQLFFEGNFGIERETLRVNKNGQLALTPHPKTFGNRAYHPYIQTDFSESQLEFITATKNSVEEVYRQLEAIHDVAYRSISDEELLWANSMPAGLPEADSIPIIKVEDQSQIDYRLMLAKKYGRKRQVISGIHYNFSFSDDFIEVLYQASGQHDNLIEFKNRVYMHISEHFMRYRWLITYLMSAAPAVDSTFYNENEQHLIAFIRSVRNSEYGYVNNSEEDTTVSYHTAEDYVDDLLRLVETKELDQIREYYGSVRPRSEGDFKDLPSEGIAYLELRSFDLNPYSSVGMTLDQMHFVHLFILYLLCLEPMTNEESKEAVEKGAEMNILCAGEKPNEPTQFEEEGRKIINGMSELLNALGFTDKYGYLIDKATELFDQPETTLSARVAKDMGAIDNFVGCTIEQSKKYKQAAFEAPYQLRGYTEMEMSTQLLMFDAIQKGVEVEVVDEEDQFILLRHGDHEEYVQKANKTTKDNYVSQLMMANKTVTKYALNRRGFVVPKSKEVHSVEEGLSYYDSLSQKKLVIKPKSTNFGVGITILETGSSSQQVISALENAFAEDVTVLMEDFVEGTEYRFFVLDGKTLAVLLRVPAKVSGDGKSTIKELIVEKNQHPLRGSDHRKPLEKIEINQILLDTIEAQGYHLEDVLDSGEDVYLRRNSNISTGGDSIDFTKDMDDSYKEVAAEIGEALGANITGVDLIIPDYQVKTTKENPTYTCLEANFNPAMHMHQFVEKGEGVRVSLHVLDLLFKELNLLTE